MNVTTRLAPRPQHLPRDVRLDPILDDDTVIELNPVCETVVSLTDERCEAPAHWIIRTHCKCGARFTDLMCHTHTALLDSVTFQCDACGAIQWFYSRTSERL